MRKLTVPTLRLPRSEEQHRRGLALSMALHLILLALLFWQPASDFEPNRAPGGPGPVGGGGGGGSSEVVYYAVVNTSQSSSEAVQAEQEQDIFDLVMPEVAQVEVDLSTKLRVPRSSRAVTTDIEGVGEGTGGGPGSGTGRGGGSGAGFGTGIGNAVGPGTGGEGGDVFPPVPRYTIMPPLPRPSSLKGKSFKVRFWVNESGRVLKVEVQPQIRDASYRRKFLSLMYEYTFTPATTRAGERVAGRTELEITL